MRLNTLFLTAVIGSFALPACKAADAAGEDTKPAIEAAEKWLALVDGGDYARSWDEAASYFRGAVAKDTWVAQVSGVRGPLGAVERRTLKSATFTKNLPGAPDGSYVVIQFTTSFANKKSAVETITPMLDQGTWRVSGYYIK